MMKEIDGWFWTRVDKTDDCWLWTGAQTDKGFGKYRTEDGWRTPHRLVWEMHNGPLPSRTPLTQICGDKLCVYPEHLVLKANVTGDWSKRFWSYVAKTDTCWVWTGYRDPYGYGRLTVKNTPRLAHRLAYELEYGTAVPPVLDHKCHNTSCVNPEHLRPVTQKQNTEHRRGLPTHNTSGVLGVSWSKSAGKWLARVKHEGKVYDFGYHTDIDTAAAAVVAGRLSLFTHNDRDRT